MEVSPTAKPPVCRVMDFGKYKYEQAKKQHNVRLHQRGMQLKEIKVRPYVDKHDLEIKVKNVIRFLEERNKAKITVTFRGRERANTSIGNPIMEAFIEGIKDVGVVESPPKREGDNMTMLLGPKAEVMKAKKQQSPTVGAEVRASAKDKIIIESEGGKNEQDKA